VAKPETETGAEVQGDRCDCVFYIHRGDCKVSVISERGKEAVVALHQKGDFFGEGCLTGIALFYAHEFHSETRRSGGRGAGFDFRGQKSPDYLDFLYLSLVIGTTAQTSDIDITSRETRRTVMLHGLLSFFFNTTVIALVVNLTAQFAG